MGTFYYGDARYAIPIEDRALAHLKLVILTKLRRNESFAFSWDKGIENGHGRGTIWIHPALALHFDFAGTRHPEINRAWLEEMSISANQTLGLVIGKEPRFVADDLATA